MRTIATLILLAVAITAQAITPLASHSDNLALATKAHAAQQASPADTSSAIAATDDDHDSGDASREHCHIGGHCSPSALDNNALSYHVQHPPSVSTAGRINSDALPGFASSPYRPPSPV